MEILKYWESSEDDEYFMKIKVENKNEFYIWREGYFQQIKYINFKTWEYELLNNYILKDHKYYKEMAEIMEYFIEETNQYWLDAYESYMCDRDD